MHSPMRNASLRRPCFSWCSRHRCTLRIQCTMLSSTTASVGRPAPSPYASRLHAGCQPAPGHTSARPSAAATVARLPPLAIDHPGVRRSSHGHRGSGRLSHGTAAGPRSSERRRNTHRSATPNLSCGRDMRIVIGGVSLAHCIYSSVLVSEQLQLQCRKAGRHGTIPRQRRAVINTRHTASQCRHGGCQQQPLTVFLPLSYGTQPQRMRRLRVCLILSRRHLHPASAARHLHHRCTALSCTQPAQVLSCPTAPHTRSLPHQAQD